MNKIETPFGHVEIFGGNDEFNSSILVIYPGKEIPAEFHKKMTEFEMILEGELEFRGKILKKGDCQVRKPGEVHGYKNNSEREARVLCITIPPFDEKDVFKAI